MKVNVRQRDGVTILDLKGKITIGMGDVALRNAVQEAINSGSSGVGELVSAFTTATNRGVKLSLANLPSKVSDILQITQLITVFDVFDSEDEAIRSF
jgi:anti-sigma B factor antagonist